MNCDLKGDRGEYQIDRIWNHQAKAKMNNGLKKYSSIDKLTWLEKENVHFIYQTHFDLTPYWFSQVVCTIRSRPQRLFYSLPRNSTEETSAGSSIQKIIESQEPSSQFGHETDLPSLWTNHHLRQKETLLNVQPRNRWSAVLDKDSRDKAQRSAFFERSFHRRNCNRNLIPFFLIGGQLSCP